MRSTIIRLAIRPGLTAWWGSALVSVDSRARWTVHQPEPPAADHVRDYLNARYGSGRLEQLPISQLIREAMNDLDGETLP